MDTRLENTLRRAIKASGLSYYRIAIDCGVNACSVARFVKRENTLRLDVAGRIAEYLGLELKEK